MADTLTESTTGVDIALTALAAYDLLKLKGINGSVFLYLSPATIKFVAEMEKALAAHKSFGDKYKATPPHELMEALDESVEKLKRRWKEDGISSQLTKDAADVANFAMFLALNAMEGRIL